VSRFIDFPSSTFSTIGTATLGSRFSRIPGCWGCNNAENKKADVTEHPKAFDHVGLLFTEPPGAAKLLFI
jgi:hypothetical protein